MVLLLKVLILSCLMVVTSVCFATEYNHNFTSFSFEKSISNEGFEMLTTVHDHRGYINESNKDRVRRVCSSFLDWNILDCANCVNTIHQSNLLSVTKNHIARTVGNSQRILGLDIPILYQYDIYDSIMNSDSVKARLGSSSMKTPNICLFGDYSGHIFHNLLHIYPSIQIKYFADGINDTITNHSLNLLLRVFSNFEVVHTSFDSYIAETLAGTVFTTGVGNVCDILHVRGENTDILHILELLNSLHSVKGRRSTDHNQPHNDAVSAMEIPIIWERTCLHNHAGLRPIPYETECGAKVPSLFNHQINNIRDIYSHTSFETTDTTTGSTDTTDSTADTINTGAHFTYQSDNTDTVATHTRRSHVLRWRGHGVWLQGSYEVQENNGRSTLRCGLIKSHNVNTQSLVDTWYGSSTYTVVVDHNEHNNNDHTNDHSDNVCNIGNNSMSNKIGSNDDMRSYTSNSSQIERNNDTSKCVSNRRKNKLSDTYLVITFTEPIFLETAYGLQNALLLLQYKNIEVMAHLNLTRIEEIEQSYVKCSEQGSINAVNIIQIVIGPHQPALLLPQYVMFHTENTLCPFLYIDNYISTVRNALAVLVYSHIHVPFVRDTYGIDNKNIFLIPFYTRSVYHHHVTIAGVANAMEAVALSGFTGESDFGETRSSTAQTAEQSTEQLQSAVPLAVTQPENDIFFFGSYAVRREAFHNMLVAATERDGLSYLSAYTLKENLEIYSYDTQTKEFFITQSKVVLSIHSDGENIALEVHRINHLLSLGKCVISERSADPQLDALYEGAVIFAELQDMYEIAKELVRDKKTRLSMEKRAFLKYEEIRNNVANLNAALDRAIENSCVVNEVAVHG